MGGNRVKPKIGEPCNGCGLCCEIVICNTGAFAMGFTQYFGEKSIKEPCKALTKMYDGRKLCGLMITPNKYIGKTKYPERVIKKHISILIGAGYGCDDIGYDEYDQEEMAKLDALVQSIMNDPEKIEQKRKSLEFLEKLKYEQ